MLNVLPVFDAQAYGWMPDNTDHSTEALALLNAINAAGGGTIYFPPSTGKYRADSQLFIPNNAALIPEQVNIRFTGAGGGTNWGDVARDDVGAAVLDLRYTAIDGNAKIESRGSGALLIDNLTFTDGGAANATPFIHVTNTTLTVRGCTFLGSGSATQDAIVLGGTSQTAGSGVTAPFQGYGTIIDSNHFRTLNRGVFGRTFSNSVVVTNNSWLNSTGTVAIEFRAETGNPPDVITGLYVTGNIIEMGGIMTYGVVLQAVRSSYFCNSFYDPSGSYASDYRLVVGSGGAGFGSTLNTFVISLSGGTNLTQSGDIVQLSQSTIIAAGAGNTTGGLTALVGSEFYGGILCKSQYSAAKDYPGGFTAINYTAPNMQISMAMDSGNNRGVIDAFDLVDNEPRYIAINPRLGAVQTGAQVISPQSSNYGVLVSDSSKHFNNVGATGEVDFTLPSDPTAFAYWGTPVYSFSVNAAQVVKIIAGNGLTTINLAGTVSTAGGNITSSTVGASIKLVASYGNPSRSWIAESIVGDWVVDGATVVAGAASNVLTANNTNTISTGYTVTPGNGGTLTTGGTFTATAVNGNYQYYTNNGAHTFANPSADCAIDVLVTNATNAGAITFSTFTVGTTGDALTTTNGNKFIISTRRINGTSTYLVKALQ